MKINMIIALTMVLMLIFLPATSCQARDSMAGAAPAKIAGETVSFIAVGDNLIHQQVYRACYRPADESYDFSPIYAQIRPEIERADIAFVNQESLCAGEAFGYSDYPYFNGPTETLDALREAGFDWISTANNHSLDRGEEGVLAQLDAIERLGGGTERPSGVIQTGTYASAADAETPRVIEKNGVRVGLASYTYGTNGQKLPEGKEYLVSVFDSESIGSIESTDSSGRIGSTGNREKICANMKALCAASDIQVVGMHWGEEGVAEPTDGQRAWAQLLADLGVDVVIGTHPHVLGGAEFLHGENGNEMLVYWSLGNFISSQPEPEQMLGGMARFAVCYDANTGSISFPEAALVPVVTHIEFDYSKFTAYLLSDYPEELAARHALAPKGFSAAALAGMAQSTGTKPQPSQ
jgi:poly-gamma-glutamate synthesis protein (capsule biosynthesis protein)